MFQKIVETTNINGSQIHGLENGALVSAFEIDLFDEELLGHEQTERFFQNLLREIPDGRTLRIYLKSDYSNEQKFEHSRKEATVSIGFIKNRAVVMLEKYPGFSLPIFKNKASKPDGPAVFDLELFKEAGFSVKSLGASEIENFFPKLGEEIQHNFQTIDLGPSLVSILRLTKQSEFSMSMQTLSHMKDVLPVPYFVSVSIQPVTQATAESFLRRRSKQNEGGSDIKDSRKHLEAQSDLEDISLNGSKLYRFEWLCLLERDQEAILRTQREEVKRRLKPIGEVYIESVGALESFKSFYPGTEPHFMLFEKENVLVTYLPLMSRGDPISKIKVEAKSLIVHRKDESLSPVNIFDPRYESFSWCIFGRPGTGKSVLTNAFTRALVFDPNVKVIKIDVGGSHSRETEMLGGVERTLNLNQPTGINPFNVITELGSTKEAIQILASFLEVLLLEEGETKLSKTMKSDLEKAVQAYSDSSNGVCSLDAFFRQSQDLPRRDLLQRWVGTGVYANAFCEKTDADLERSLLNSRLIYFNFSKISQALDPDYAQGGLAAVMAQFNLEMLKKTKDKKRIVFIADETPFFIKKCFSFFNLSIANVRKEGHGFITVAQKTAHVVVNEDTGILDNSPNKVFFSADGDDESFMARTQTDSETMEKIKSLQRKQGEYSEALLKDNRGERVIRIRLSPQEYWSYTSKDEDRQKFQQVRDACPNLKIEEIIRCLSCS